MNDRKDNAPHILNTSSTLLGLCFVVLTSLKVTNKSDTTNIDELTAVAILLFMMSSLLSFLSMRSHTSPSLRYEKAADFIFLAGLFFLFITTVFIIFDIGVI